MRSGKRLAWAIALSALVGCGGKVVEGTGEGGTGGSGATGGLGGTGATGGWGGHTDGGSGGYGGGYGGYGGGYGGYGGGYGGYGGGDGGASGYGGYGGSYGGAGGSMSCAFNVGWPQCENCVYNKCAAECSSCTMNWECGQVLQCFQYCGAQDAPCLQGCMDKFPGAAPYLEEFFGNCMANKCTYECSDPGGSGGGGYGGGYGGYGGGYGGYGGGYGGYGGGYGGSGGGPLCPMQLGFYQCDQCIGQQCMAECTSCYYNADCQNLFNCMMQCQDEQCQNECINKFPAGLDPLIQMFGADEGCVYQKCYSQCGG